MAFKTFVKSVPFIGDVILKWYRRYCRWRLCPERLITKVFHGEERLQIVQIGSNDGRSGDPIHSLLILNQSWRALLVEPVPFVFERLRKNYPDDPRFRFENVAIAEKTGFRPFYYIGEAAKEQAVNVSLHFDQLGSFDREHIIRHCGHALDSFVVIATVPTLPLAELLNRNEIFRIDLLHIDTEGYDWKILQTLDLRRYEPTVILFEHKHLSDDTRKEARRFLQDDYKITDLGADYFCIRKSVQQRGR